MNPSITIVVPLYQSQSTVRETLSSLAAQGAPGIEVVVVDDGSTDGGSAVAAAFASADARFRVVRQENRGLSGARNTGIRESRAPIVGFCDADDAWEPGKAAAHIEAFAADPALGLSFSGCAVVGPGGAPTGRVQRPSVGPVDLERMLLTNPVGNGSSAVVARVALDTVAFERDGRTQWFDESLRRSEDIDMWCRLLAAGVTARGIPDPLVRYRVSQGGLSSDGERQVESWITVRDRLAAVAPEAVRRVGGLALASQMRWQARKALFAGDGRSAASWCRRMVAAHPGILLHEPAKTWATIAAAAACAAAPSLTRRLVR